MRCSIFLALLAMISPAIAFAAPHALDPLSAEEIGAAADVIKGFEFFPEGASFATLVLHEPPKAEVLSGKAIRREAFAILYDHGKNRTFEAVVDLKKQTIVSWAEIEGAQPLVMPMSCPSISLRRTLHSFFVFGIAILRDIPHPSELEASTAAITCSWTFCATAVASITTISLGRFAASSKNPCRTFSI